MHGTVRCDAEPSRGEKGIGEGVPNEQVENDPLSLVRLVVYRPR